MRPMLHLSYLMFTLLATSLATAQPQEISTEPVTHPLFAVPGEEFSVLLDERFSIGLPVPNPDEPGPHYSEEQQSNGRKLIRITLPSDIPVGVQPVTLQNTKERYTVPLFVLKEWPQVYAVAVLELQSFESSNIDSLVGEINAIEAALVFITGPATLNPEVHLLLEMAQKPVVLVPGYTHPAVPRVLNFGRDSFLLFDTTTHTATADGSYQEGRLQQLRAEIKPSRWSIGITHDYAAISGTRTMLSLFVDNPLDFLFTGPWHGAVVEEKPVIEWGATGAAAALSPGVAGITLIDVTETAILPRVPTATEPAAPAE